MLIPLSFHLLLLALLNCGNSTSTQAFIHSRTSSCVADIPFCRFHSPNIHANLWDWVFRELYTPALPWTEEEVDEVDLEGTKGARCVEKNLEDVIRIEGPGIRKRNNFTSEVEEDPEEEVIRR